jgi:hypothetical protein
VKSERLAENPGACLACEAVVNRGDGGVSESSGYVPVFGPAYAASRALIEMGVNHDVPLLIKASQARHAPQLVPYVDAYAWPKGALH